MTVSRGNNSETRKKKNEKDDRKQKFRRERYLFIDKINKTKTFKKKKNLKRKLESFSS